MSATIARQGGQVQLEQSDMRLALNMAKMANRGFSHATIEDREYQIKKHRAVDREEMRQGVEFPGCMDLKPAMERQPAMLRADQMDGCLPWQNGTAQNPQTCLRRKGTGAPPHERLRQPTPELAPLPPGMPPLPLGDDEGAHASAIHAVRPGYVFIHTSLSRAQMFILNAYAKDCNHDGDFDWDLLTDEGTSTG